MAAPTPKATKAPSRKATPTSHPSSRSGRRSESARRYGSETARVYTKPLRRLHAGTSKTPATTLGFEVIEFAAWLRARLLHVAALTEDPNLAAAYRALIPELLPWQKWFLIHALELLPGTGQVFRFRIILLLVARQNGKTTLMIVLILWRLFQDGAPKIIGASTKLEQAEVTWDIVVLIAELIPELSDEIGHVGKVNGQKSLQLDSLQEYFPQATNSNAGRGWAAELVFVDELRAQKTWGVWSAISKTTTAKERGMVIAASNAGDLSAVVLRQLRNAAVDAIEGRPPAGVEDEDLDQEMIELLEEAAVGLFEWSAREGRSIRDRAGWYEANPSLGWTITERAIAVSLSEPEWEFRTEVLCQFVDTTEGGPFAEGSWEDVAVDTVTRDTAKPAGYIVDVSHDRKMAHVGVAFHDTAGRIRVEIAQSKAGTDWVIPWLKSPKRKIPIHKNITFQRRGAPVSSLMQEFEDAGLGDDVIDWSSENFSRSFGMGYDEVLQKTITHGTTGAQKVLNVAAGTARVKPSGDGSWMVDRKNSSEDVAPLVVFFGGVFLLRVALVKQRPSVYETRGLISL